MNDNEKILAIQDSIRSFPKILLKHVCMTGSSMLVSERDLTGWNSDVDLFAYNSSSFVALAHYMRWTLGWKLGETEELHESEKLKFEWSAIDGWKWGDWRLVTLKFRTPDPYGVVVNLSIRQHCNSAPDVICAFDMTPIMIAEDLFSGEIVDLRGEPNVARPNPFKRPNFSKWAVARWLRQADRVQKYESRGFDVSPLRDFYVALVETAIAQLDFWKSNKNEEQLLEIKETREDYEQALVKLKALSDANKEGEKPYVQM